MHSKQQTYCRRCGTCCRKGGPTLHHEDKPILLAGHVGHQHLVTIRRGELVFDPRAGALRPTDRELVKVRGRGPDWSCCLFDQRHSACTIYEHRFLECRLLKCWDPSALLAVIGRDTVTRADLINPGDPVLELINAHEQECPMHEVRELTGRLSRGRDTPGNRARLAGLVRTDRAYRQYALTELGLHREYELFIFGRPLGRVLSAQGIMLP